MRAVEFLGTVVYLTEEQYQNIRNVVGAEDLRDATEAAQIEQETAVRREITLMAKVFAWRREWAQAGA